jgi:hypothetical protein
MDTAKIWAHRGAEPGDEKVYMLDPSTPLDAVRRMLTADSFLPPDAASRYRFIAARSASSKLADALVDPQVENLVPLRSVLRDGTGLIVTDVARLRNADLIGIAPAGGFMVNRNLGVSVILNEEDPEAKRTNDAISAFKPLMLTKVRTTNPDIGGGWDYVCVLVEGSVVGFKVVSWGAAGYTFSVAPDEGEAIVSDGFVGFEGKPPNSRVATVLRYDSSPRTIEILGADTVGIAPGETVRFQKVTVRSRRITSYVENGTTYTSNETPPQYDDGPVQLPHAAGLHPMVGAALAAAAAPGVGTVPGDSIKPGGPVPGPASQRNLVLYNWSAITVDDWSQALGEMPIFFFVFKDWSQAQRVVAAFNS